MAEFNRSNRDLEFFKVSRKLSSAKTSSLVTALIIKNCFAPKLSAAGDYSHHCLITVSRNIQSVATDMLSGKLSVGVRFLICSTF